MTNSIFPYPAKMMGLGVDFGGGWMVAMADLLRQSRSVKLAIASIHAGNKLEQFEERGHTYFLLPGGARAMLDPDSGLEPWWAQVVKGFLPDVLHLHGSEYAHGISLLRRFRHLPSVLSIQGLVSFWSECYLDGIDRRAQISFRTFRDIVRRDGMREQQRKFTLRGMHERQLFALTRNIIGRTTFDRAHSKALNPDAIYFHHEEMLRPAFYIARWRLRDAKRHTIFLSQSSAPYKGFHFLIRAMPSILQRFPDASVTVAGSRICDVSNWQLRLREAGYSQYLRSLIRERGIEDRIHFTGPLDEHRMADALCRSHAFVLPSSIENSPNSLCEAQVVGMPCIASYVGGVPDLVTHGHSGLLYDHRDPELLASRVLEVFESDRLAQSLGEEARRRALARHDRNRTRSELEGIYKIIARQGQGHSSHERIQET